MCKKYKETKTVDMQQLREQKRELKIKKTVVQYLCRDSAQCLVRCAVHVVSRTICEWYAIVQGDRCR